MKRWLRVVLPRTGYVTIFFAVYSVELAVSLRIIAQSGWVIEESSRLFFIRDAFVTLAAIAYGSFRVAAFHPVFNKKYLKFLKQTAWTAEKPLPVGPVHLIWQDAVILLVMMVMVWHVPFSLPWRVFHCGMIVYLLGLSYAFLQCRVWSYMYALLFGLGAAFLFWSNPLIVSAIIIALYGVGFLGIKRSLNVLYLSAEEDLLRWEPLSSLSADRNVRLKKVNRLSGWPFDVLAPKSPSINMMKGEVTGLSAFHGILISLLAGWWMFSITFNVWRIHLRVIPVLAIPISYYSQWEDQFVDQVENKTELVQKAAEALRQEYLIAQKSSVRKELSELCVIMIMIGGCGLIGWRLWVYCKGHRSPINLWGRLWTFRWIIPEYDKVFVSPLCILLAMFGVYPVLVFYFGFSPLFAGPFTITVMFLTTLNLGPRRVDWLLTSPCRIAPSDEYKSKQLGVFEEV